MREELKKAIGRTFIDDVVRDLIDVFDRGWRRFVWIVRRRFGKLDREIAAGYFAKQGLRKLHIGCGENALIGWLNSDIYPRGGILHLDASKKFPFEGQTFDYIFTEHMIEHLTYAQGLLMLGECYRTLRTLGKLRISTPDLAFVVSLYGSDGTELSRSYIGWATTRYIIDAPQADECFVVNHLMRGWGHKFIYDEKTLRAALEQVGFTNIVRCRISESTDGELRGLENVERMPVGFLRLETLTLEAEKK